MVCVWCEEGVSTQDKDNIVMHQICWREIVEVLHEHHIITDDELKYEAACKEHEYEKMKVFGKDEFALVCKHCDKVKD